MRILALERELPAPPYSHYPDMLRAEAAAVWSLQKGGVIRDIWLTAPEHGAVMMLECADLAAARRHLASLPLVRHGRIDFTLHELAAYDGHERLFAPVGTGPAQPEEPPEY